MLSPNIQFKNKKIDLPPVNNLLPKSLDILDKDEEYSKKPVLLEQWENGELWYKKDDKFERPKGIIKVKYYTNDCGLGTSASSRVFAEVWKQVI